MRWLQNPIILKAAFTFFLSCFIVLLGVLLMRRAKRSATARLETPRLHAEHPGFSLAAYEGVITKLKEQERELERLRRSETERARETTTVNEAIISNLVSGVVLFNTALLVRQANPAARKLLGYASPSSMHARDIFKSATGIRFTENATPATPSATERLVGAVRESIAENKHFRRVEVDYATPAGEKRVLGVTISPVQLPSGERLGAACLITDLTDIARLSDQVKLQENMAALGEMSAGIAHEFKNSLATISGYAQMLQQSPQSSSDFPQRIVTETENLARIVSDFLNFARPQGGAREPLDVVALLEDCAQEAGVTMKVKSTQPRTQVVCDPTALPQAFSNLLRNTAEAAGGRATVAAEIRQQADAVELELTDNAGGIPPQHLSKIFIPFFTTKATGTGLGLALVHRVVSEHGGKISVDSPVATADGGHGTRFTLTFPRSASS